MNIPQETTMRVAIAKIELHLPHCHSLKEKRQVLRKIKDRILSRFKVSVHEVHYHDKWQRAQLGMAVVSNDARVAQTVIDQVLHEISGCSLGEVLDSCQEIVSF